MWAKLSTTAKCHFIGQLIAMFMQTVLPDLGIPDHAYHLAAILLAYVQSVVGLWALFVKYGDNAPEQIQQAKPPDK